VKTEETVAVFQAVVMGKHGRYAVATSDDVEGSITFSLGEEVWQEKDDPEPGVYLVLSGLHKKRSGWRASRARFLGLKMEGGVTDEKT